MSRRVAATIVIVVLLACTFGADLWLDAKQAEDWGWTATVGLCYWAWTLIAPDDRGRS